MSKSDTQKNLVLENLKKILKKYGKLTDETYTQQNYSDTFPVVLYNGTVVLRNVRSYFHMFDDLTRELGTETEGFKKMYKLCVLPIPDYPPRRKSKRNKINVQLFTRPEQEKKEETS